MRPSTIPFCLLLGMLAPLHGAEVIVPEFLQTTDISKTPYKYNGLLSTGDAIGSASLVGDGIIATAAHVIFDEEELSWIPINRILYYPQYHQTTPFSPSGTFYPPVGFIRFADGESYKTRVEDDNSGPGLSSVDTFNVDFAVGYLNKFLNSELIEEYPEVHVDAEETVSILREDRDKMIVGYPSDTDFIPSSQRGLMHRTPQANYFSWWSGFNEEEFSDTWRDSENLWVATYEFEGVATYSGNSGGPIYVLDDEGEWAVAGIVVGSVGSSAVLTRGIDETAWDLIEAAIAARGVSPLARVEDLVATPAGGSAVKLQWTDQSTGEAGYHVLRLDRGIWETVVDMGPDNTAWTDTRVDPGHVYRYSVQAIDPAGNRAPKSPAASVTLDGANQLVGDHFAQPWLLFLNNGDSNWHLDGSNSLRAGAVNSMGRSGLQLSVIGPGTLTFDWRVSSEENPEFKQGTPETNQLYFDIYDAIHLYLDGERVAAGDTTVFLSGLDIGENRAIEIPEGPHTVEWVYEKDPYSTEGEDTAYLESLQWTPSPGSPYPVMGGYGVADNGVHASVWFGAYETTGSPWIRHHEFGWMYMRAGDGFGLHVYSPEPDLGNLYTTPEIFPFFYSFDRGDWLYYYDDSGTDGRNLSFFDYKNAVILRID